ncbi:MAG: DUF935 family protein [Candidatus Obscuribacterales bacterium]|jgi:hypothetical protein
MFEAFKRRFKAPTAEAAIPTKGEVAWSESSMYRGADFPKYNPDALLNRKGYAIYTKMMTDEQIKAVVRFKRDAITSRNVFFECEHESLSEADNEFREMFFEHVLDQMSGSFGDALNGVMSSLYNGFSITEKIHKVIEFQDKAWVGIDRLEVKPCDTFFFHVDQYGTVEKVVQKFDMNEQEIDLEKFIHFVQNPDVDKHYGRSELRECYRAWFSKDMAIKFQNIHLERFAAGFIWAQPIAGKTLVLGSTEFTTLQSVMSNLQATSSIILPSGIELHVEHPATTDMFERKIAQEDKAIAKCLLVPNLLGITEQGNVGSYSQSETQLEAFFWTLEADSKRLEDTINEQLFWELGEINFGDGYYPRLKFKPLSEKRKMEIVKTWTSLVTGKAVQASDTDEAYLREMLEFPEKGEPLVVPAPPIDPSAPKLGPDGKPIVDPNAPPEQKPADKPAVKPDDKPMEETVVGKQAISISAFYRAMKRVDFAVIANKADNSTKDTAYELAVINSAAVARVVALANELHLGTAEGRPEDMQKITYTASEMSALKAAATKGLKEAWTIGESHARREISKAKGAEFRSDDLALQDLAVAYLKQKGYTLAGDISAATQKTIRNILMEGIKVSKTADEIKRAIYKALEADGMLTEESVVEALGTTTVKSANARIETAIRTTSFEAINEARYSFFSDPGLDGFVEALEYSAVLDDRTCFAAGTLIQSTKGAIPIESVMPNDEVISGAGHVRKVNARKTAISTKWRELTLDDGTVVRATPTHPLWTLQRGGFGWVEMQEIKVGDKVGGRQMPALRKELYLSSLEAEEVLQPRVQNRDEESRMDYSNMQMLPEGIHPAEDLCGSRRDARSLLLSCVQGNESKGRTSEEGHDIHMREMWNDLYSPTLGTQGQSSPLLEEVPEFNGHKAVPYLQDGVQVKGISRPNVLFGGVLSEIQEGNTTGSNGAGNPGEYESEFSARGEDRETGNRLFGDERNSGRGGRHILAFEPTSERCGCAQGHQDKAYGLSSYQIASDGSMRVETPRVHSCVDHSVEPVADKTFAVIKIQDFTDEAAFCYDLEVENDHCYLLANGAIVHNTEICSQLNGETYSIDSDVWSTFRPPNHFNCRSILIPVTVRDTWTASDAPSAMPQKGFGFHKGCAHE